MDRVLPSEGSGCRFDSCQMHHNIFIMANNIVKCITTYYIYLLFVSHKMKSNLKIASKIQHAIALLTLGEKVYLQDCDTFIKSLETVQDTDLCWYEKTILSSDFQASSLEQNNIDCILSGYRLIYLIEQSTKIFSHDNKLDNRITSIDCANVQITNNLSNSKSHIKIDQSSFYLCQISVNSLSQRNHIDLLNILKSIAGLEFENAIDNELRENHKKNKYSVKLCIIEKLKEKLNDSLDALVKIGELFPSFLVQKVSINKYDEYNISLNHKKIHNDTTFSISCADIISYYTSMELVKICEAPLLLNSTKHQISAKITIFRYGLKDHYAIQIASSEDKNHADIVDLKSQTIVEDDKQSPELFPLVRIHSSCFTGDLLQSLRCDCHPQLHSAIDEISSHPSGGIIIYLQQEGRGIGLTNKLRTYYLQQHLNLDTAEANLYLGFADDARDFQVAAKILKSLQIFKISLLTNNPNKAKDIIKYGIEVMSCISHVMTKTDNLKKYFDTKAKKFGHINLS